MSKNRITPYIIGFASSVVLTLAAYLAVADRIFPTPAAVIAVICLALAQFLMQIFFFLHLGRESKPRWNLAVLASTIGIVLVLVLGSLWIMNHLNYNMTPAEVNGYMQDQGAF